MRSALKPRVWPEKRAIAEQARFPWRQGGPAMARTEDIVAETKAGCVRLHIHDPSPGRRKPTLGYIHVGGWAMFSLETHDRVMRELAARATAVDFVRGVAVPDAGPRGRRGTQDTGGVKAPAGRSRRQEEQCRAVTMFGRRWRA